MCEVERSRGETIWLYSCLTIIGLTLIAWCWSATLAPSTPGSLALKCKDGVHEMHVDAGGRIDVVCK